LVLVACILIFLFKILNVNNYPEKSLLYCANAQFLESFLKRVPELHEPYIPTRFWGFSGHIQTIVQSVISRFHCPMVQGSRIFLKLTDGATVSYDLYQPLEPHPEGGNFTLAVCPGIGNNSESVYIKRIVFNGQKHGYRVAVLNHIGTLANVPVTSPRIFMYGSTCDYSAMVKDIVRRYRSTRIVCVGFSMGGNLITKYIGEPRVKPANVIAGISVCQGYDANRAMRYLLEWKGFRRLYIYAMTENMKAIIRRWTKPLFTEEIKRKLNVTERQVFNSGTLQELDELYTRRLAGFSNVTDFYKSMSSCNHLKNIKIPMVFINSLDDPIVPPPLLEIIRDAALTNENFLYIEQKFGGHLGFYEGGFIYSNPVTWQDRIIVKITGALVAGHSGKKDKEVEYEETVSFTSTLLPKNTSVSSDEDELPKSPVHVERKDGQRIPFFETPVTSEQDCSGPDEDSDGSLAGELAGSGSLEWDDPGNFHHALTPPNTPMPKSRYRAVGLNLFPN